VITSECKFTSASLDYGALASTKGYTDEIRWLLDGGTQNMPQAVRRFEVFAEDSPVDRMTVAEFDINVISVHIRIGHDTNTAEEIMIGDGVVRNGFGPFNIDAGVTFADGCMVLFDVTQVSKTYTGRTQCNDG